MPVLYFASLFITAASSSGAAFFFALNIVFVAVINHDLSIAFSSAAFALGLSFDFENVVDA